ncbi:MAG: serine protease [Deltaproteobacteria bacterium]|nr:serine protease [Deltaproteobacteria bacterium]
MADSAGVSIVSIGECATTPPPTDVCIGNDQCGEAEYCKFIKEQCTWQTLLPIEGTCTPRPEYCIYLYLPVCGCDSKTYGNECEAAAAGTSIASQGACQ